MGFSPLQCCSGAAILETLGAAVGDGGTWVVSNCPVFWHPAVWYHPTLLCTWQPESITGLRLPLLLCVALSILLWPSLKCAIFKFSPPSILPGCELHSHPCLTPLLQTNFKPPSGPLLEEACQPYPWSQLQHCYSCSESWGWELSCKCAVSGVYFYCMHCVYTETGICKHENLS